MKKLFSLILALALVLSLAACGAGGAGNVDTTLTQEKLKGTWSLEMDISALMQVAGDALSSTMGMGDVAAFIDSIPNDLTLSVLMVFDGNGNMNGMIKKQDFNDFYTNMINAILTEDTMYAIYESQGMDKATVDAALAAQGMTISSLISMTKLQMSSMDVSEMLSQSESAVVKGDYLIIGEATEYTIEGNKVIMDDSTIEYDGVNLLLKEIESEDEDTPDLSGILPLTIKRLNSKTEY